MSLSALADQEIGRREQSAIRARLKPQVTEHANMMLDKLGVSSAKLNILEEGLMPLAAAPPIEPTKGSNALDSLARYIPTEVITLYVAACSAMTALKDKVPGNAPYWVYWGFVGLTPLLFLIILLGKRRSADLPAFPSLGKWPWWKLFASLTAFGIWALAVPGTPYLSGEVGGVVAAFLALFISTFLTLLEPIFETKTSENTKD